jgi:hypothetical protein
MKKTYSAPLVTTSEVVRDTELGTIPKTVLEKNTLTKKVIP